MSDPFCPLQRTEDSDVTSLLPGGLMEPQRLRLARSLLVKLSPEVE